jgi:myosin heavy subunit
MQAQQSRDAFAKAVYANLFGWLVEKVNLAAQEKNKQQDPKPAQRTHFLGLLDIFGFEVMEHNSFEQLMINYANEVLQHFFNQRVFVKEQAFYESEHVKLPKVWFADNIRIVDLIKGAPNGILQLLDQQNKLGGSGSDKQFLSSIYRAHGGPSSAKQLMHTTVGKHHPNLLRPRIGGDTFIIKHFAGQVEYSATGFIAKNNESLTHDLAQLILTTTNDFLHSISEQDSQKSPSTQAQPPSEKRPQKHQ